MPAAALRAHGLTAKNHVFWAGGHGFGLRKAAGKPVAIWPELMIEWARLMGSAPPAQTAAVDRLAGACGGADRNAQTLKAKLSAFPDGQFAIL